MLTPEAQNDAHIQKADELEPAVLDGREDLPVEVVEQFETVEASTLKGNESSALTAAVLSEDLSTTSIAQQESLTSTSSFEQQSTETAENPPAARMEHLEGSWSQTTADMIAEARRITAYGSFVACSSSCLCRRTRQRLTKCSCLTVFMCSDFPSINWTFFTSHSRTALTTVLKQSISEVTNGHFGRKKPKSCLPTCWSLDYWCLAFVTSGTSVFRTVFSCTKKA